MLEKWFVSITPAWTTDNPARTFSWSAPRSRSLRVGIAARHATIVAALLTGLLGTSGCGATASQQTDADIRAEAEQVLGTAVASPTQPAADAPADSGLGWAVMLQRYPRSSVADARNGARRAADILGRQDVSIRDTGEALVLTIGNFESPNDDDAQAAITAIKSFQSNGTRPFARAFLIPPPFDDVGSYEQYNLPLAAERAGLYNEQTMRMEAVTLQVETYDDVERTRRAQVAEQRVLELRRQGEAAYYHHGRRYSTVTIGLFGREDYDPDTGHSSGIIEATQERFPLALLNGRTQRFVGSTEPIRSFLVNVPTP